MELRIEQYTPAYKKIWDDFVINKSMNGTFLQTRQFLEYHGNRFKDASLIIFKGQNTIIAVLPACIIQEEAYNILCSHRGSTFGGIVIAQQFNNIEHVEAIMNILESFFITQRYDEVQLKSTPCIFSKPGTELLSYFLFQRGFSSYDEISSYIDFQNYQEDITVNFTASKRRDYKYSLKYNLDFRELHTTEEIENFYQILCENLQKFDTSPVHSFEELLDFKEDRLKNIVEFYGVFWHEELIAGSMLFNFTNKVLHTQYLASSSQYLKMFPMNFLDTNLIMLAKERGFRYFSFGTSTEQHGKILNKHLAQFKEGFGTEYGLNRTFVKKYI